MERDEQIRRMFNRAADGYDRFNHIFSAGLDFWWRRAAVRMSGAGSGDDVVDLCCGTGDMAFAFARYGRVRSVTGCDFSPMMLRAAQRKERRANKGRVHTVFKWIVAPALRTPLSPQCCDIVSCAFGIRNVTRRPGLLAEMHRLLRPGGRVCILEFALPEGRVLRRFYRFYMDRVMPAAGQYVIGSKAAVEYLTESIRAWENEVDLQPELQQTGFEAVTSRSLSAHIAKVYLAQKPGDQAAGDEN